MNQVNWVTLIVALLGAAKIVLEAFGINVIDDDMIDKAANAVAAIITLLGVVMSHSKPKEVAQNEFTTPIEPSA